MEGYANHIVQYSSEYSLCAGCEACSIMCGLKHDGFTGPENGRIKVNLGTRSVIHEILSCQQCLDHPCYDACPKQGEAMRIDEETGVVYVVAEHCIACLKCMKACKFTPSRITLKRSNDKAKRTVVKCDLCRHFPDGPQCIKHCQVRCIGLSGDSELREDGWWPKSADLS